MSGRNGATGGADEVVGLAAGVAAAPVGPSSSKAGASFANHLKTWLSPCRIGVVGDLGETANSTQTVAGLVDAQTDVVINVGDYTCEVARLAGL